MMAESNFRFRCYRTPNYDDDSEARSQGVHRCFFWRGISCGGQYSPLGHGI